jgi:hypothetical protein
MGKQRKHAAVSHLFGMAKDEIDEGGYLDALQYVLEAIRELADVADDLSTLATTDDWTAAERAALKRVRDRLGAR